MQAIPLTTHPHLTALALTAWVWLLGPVSLGGLAANRQVQHVVAQSVSDWLGLAGPENESRWGARFFVHIQTGPGAHPASCTVGTGSFPGVKRLGRGADPPPSSAEVENE
jgi:hypothetical protein